MAARELSFSELTPVPSQHFRTTDWTMVLAAGELHSAAAAEPLERLCRIYWYPIYAFVRRCGKDPHEAKDLTQDFFLHLVEHDILKGVAPQKGKFRSFLLVALRNLLANQWKRHQAVKRGGKHCLIPLDELLAESRYQQEPSHDITPEKIFDLTWAAALLDQVQKELRATYAAEGKEALFEAIQNCLCGEHTDSYAAIGAHLDMSEGAIKMAVLRLRRRYRDLLTREIANTVAEPDQIESELRYLLACVGPEF